MRRTATEEYDGAVVLLTEIVVVYTSSPLLLIEDTSNVPHETGTMVKKLLSH